MVYDLNDALSWIAPDNAHTIKLTLAFRHEREHELNSANIFGTFAYPSLAALASNTPASFTRSTAATATAGGAETFAASLGDSWRPTQALQLQYGLRMDMAWFPGRILYNAAVDSAFGVRNDLVPHPVGLSPRLGFTWSPSSESHRFSPASSHVVSAPSTSFVSTTQITGGIGAFRGLLDPSLVTSAASSTGLPMGVAQLTCVGAAVPDAQWASYPGQLDRVPTQCADGSGAQRFASDQPAVTLLTPGLQPPTSWRSSLGWHGSVVRRWTVGIDATYALGLHQPDPVNLNVVGVPGFALTNEANRPVFVSPAAIVPATGAVAPTAVERDTALGSVTAYSSDLQSVTTQLVVTAVPVSSARWGSYSLTYTYMSSREQSRGFSTPSAGDPRLITWVPGDAPRHQFNVNTAIRLPHQLTLSLWSAVTSGSRFTPIVSGNISGTGVTNRAFIFGATDPQAGPAMTALLDASSKSIQDCLRRQTGQVAATNSCATPWSANVTAFAALTAQPKLLRWGDYETTTSLQFVNPLTAVDQLLGGALRLDQWDRAAGIDPILLYVSGFDPATQTFHYDVNQHFGTANQLTTGIRPPFTVRLQLAVNYHHRVASPSEGNAAKG